MIEPNFAAIPFTFCSADATTLRKHKLGQSEVGIDLDAYTSNLDGKLEYIIWEDERELFSQLAPGTGTLLLLVLLKVRTFILTKSDPQGSEEMRNFYGNVWATAKLSRIWAGMERTVLNEEDEKKLRRISQNFGRHSLWGHETHRYRPN